MISLPSSLSLAFFFAAVAYAVAGLFTYERGRRSSRFVLFAILCFSLAIWSFSAAQIAGAANSGTALFWHRIAAVGWSLFFALQLHFILVLTGFHKAPAIKWGLVALYLPAAVGILAFAVFDKPLGGLINVAETSLGWTETALTGPWQLFKVIYAAVFAAATLALLLVWLFSSAKSGDRKAAAIVTSAFVAALALFLTGGLTFHGFSSGETRLLLPLFLILPMAANFWVLRRSAEESPHKKNRLVLENVILTEDTQAETVRYALGVYIVLSFSGVVLSYLNGRGSHSTALLYGAAVVLFGLVIFYLSLLKLSPGRKSLLSNLLAAISIPVVTLWFVPLYGATVWAFPAVWLILSILFRSRKSVFLILASFVLTQAYLWLMLPGTSLDAKELALRIVIFVLLMLASLFVNRVFVSRLKEYGRQNYEYKLISKISSDFINVSEVNIDDLIREMLELIGRHSRASGAFFFSFPKEQEPITYTFEWRADGAASLTGDIKAFPPSTITWLKNRFTTINQFKPELLDSLPSSAFGFKNLINRRGIQSMLYIPVANKGQQLGMLGLTALDPAHTWGEDVWYVMKVMGDILANGLNKVTAEYEIHQMAFYDTLTGLPNRALFRNRLDYEMKKSNRTEKMIGVVFLDLDNFKYVNDTIGHKAGDELLRQVSARLSACIREIDTLSRFGGDEFLFMLTNISCEDDIQIIMAKILDAVKQPVTINGQEYFVTGSAGVAIYPTDGYDSETLIKNADMAMYSSKSQGKNFSCFCSPDMKNEALEKMRLRNSLYRAQERNELVIHYQPQIDIKTRQIVGMEALIRWEHPYLGQILPDKFISLAEQTGLINPIGEWLIETACRQSIEWQDMGLPPCRIAANLSVLQLRDEQIVGIVRKILERTGLDPALLELEITESMAIKNSNSIMRTLSKLKRLGVLIAIDDFGTDYSSFLQLKLLSVDRIKMDMQFTQGISRNKKDEAIVKGIIQLAKNLDIKVIAEGVETDAQFEFLSKNACNEAQGYYFYKPMTGDDARNVLMNNQKTR